MTRVERPQSEPRGGAKPARPIIERDGNVVRLRFDLRPDPRAAAPRAWYHAEAVLAEADAVKAPAEPPRR